MIGIIGKKVGMTRVIADDGRVIPVTVIQCTPNKVTQVKTVDKDGYPAVVLGFDALKKPTKNRHFRVKKEFKTDTALAKDAVVNVEIFTTGERVKVSGVSKGKGFQGVIKRYNFSRGPETHGSHHHREPGSIGCRAKPGRVHKGKKLPGRMGSESVTIRDVEVIHIDKDDHLIAVKGAVPGAANTIITITKQAK